MKRRWRILLVVAGCGVVAAVALVLSRDSEPEYKGRTLTEWLLVYSDPGFYPHGGLPRGRLTAEGGEAADAVRHIGTNALPWLLKWVRYEGDGSSINRLRQTAVWRLPSTRRKSFILRWLLTDRAGRQANSAVAGFQILGAHASAAVPPLARLVQESKAPDTVVRAMRCLADVGPDGLPPLIAAMTNRANPGHVRAVATSYVADVAAQVKTNASAVVPLLVQFLEDRDQRVAEEAAMALGQLAIEPDLSVPALTNALSNSSPFVRCAAARSLGRFERQAAPGVPALVNALGDAVTFVRQAATNALREIDPEALKKGDGAGLRTD